jgi:putative membrane protein
LKQLATQKGAMLPDQLSHKEQTEFDRMQKLSGKDFDKSYAERAVKDHKMVVKEFQSAAKDAQDPELKAFAEKTLPTLEHHTQMAEQMESSLKQAEP